MNFRWKKGFLNDYKIFDKEFQIGSLKNQNNFSDITLGEIQKKKISFKKTNIFENEAIIKDEINNQIIGKIKYNIWNNKADIEIENKKYEWKYNNVWNSSWYLDNLEGEKIHFKTDFFNGTITTNEPNYLDILVGLYVYKHYQKNTFIILFIILMPIWMRLLS